MEYYPLTQTSRTLTPPFTIRWNRWLLRSFGQYAVDSHNMKRKKSRTTFISRLWVAIPPNLRPHSQLFADLQEYRLSNFRYLGTDHSPQST